MSLEICLETLRQNDPDRFGMVMAAAPGQRPWLITLYALNLELARAPFQSAEPLVAEMRLQWWIDRLDEMGQGVAPPLHDVLTPLWQVWGRRAGDLVPLAEARRRDCDRRPFAAADEVIAYIDATAGGLMQAAAAALGAPDAARDVVLAQARGAGLTGWLRALPQLRALGMGLGVGDIALPAALRELAAVGQAGFAQAAAGHRAVPRKAAPALFAGASAGGFLRDVARGQVDPAAVVPEVSPFRQRAALAWLALTGRWWV